MKTYKTTTGERRMQHTSTGLLHGSHGGCPDHIELTAKLFAVTAQRDELAEALRGLFEHCAMIHRYWGDGGNQLDADAAVAEARAALAQINREE